MVVDMEPAYCGRCRELVVLNYKEPHPRCPRCNGTVTWYTDPSLRKKRDRKEREEIRWNDFCLPDADYLCPRCGAMTMKFSVTGTWD
jgi:DNA-directed RNA polymerase subunit RPC12/RpoP